MKKKEEGRCQKIDLERGRIANSLSLKIGTCKDSGLQNQRLKCATDAEIVSDER